MACSRVQLRLELTIPKAADEWGNALAEAGQPPPKRIMRACEARAEENATDPESFDLQLGAEEMATLRLTETLGTFQARKTKK